MMASKAILGALKDAGLSPRQVQQAYGSHIYGDSTGGEHALYGAFMTGIPVVNVNNNRSSGLSALSLARQAVASAAAAIVCSEAFARRHGIDNGIAIIGQALTTDTPATWKNPIDLVGADIWLTGPGPEPSRSASGNSAEPARSISRTATLNRLKVIANARTHRTRFGGTAHIAINTIAIDIIGAQAGSIQAFNIGGIVITDIFIIVIE